MMDKDYSEIVKQNEEVVKALAESAQGATKAILDLTLAINAAAEAAKKMKPVLDALKGEDDTTGEKVK